MSDEVTVRIDLSLQEAADMVSDLEFARMEMGERGFPLEPGTQAVLDKLTELLALLG